MKKDFQKYNKSSCFEYENSFQYKNFLSSYVILSPKKRSHDPSLNGRLDLGAFH